MSSLVFAKAYIYHKAIYFKSESFNVTFQFISLNFGKFYVQKMTNTTKLNPTVLLNVLNVTCGQTRRKPESRQAKKPALPPTTAITSGKQTTRIYS